MNRLVKICIASLIISVALVYYFQISTGNFAAIVFFGMSVYCLSKNQIAMDKREKRITLFFSVIISVCLVIGKVGASNRSILDSLQQFRESTIKDEFTADIIYGNYESIQDKVVLIITFIGIAVVIYVLLFYLIQIQKRVSLVNTNNYKGGKWFLIGMVAIMLICWLPYFIINYPGILTFDSVNQISQLEGDIALNSHHPVSHTLLIGFCYHIGKTLFGNANGGVAIYSFVQMLIVASICSYSVYVLYQKNVNKWICLMIYEFFSLIPLNAMYAIAMWKDILFAAFVLWFSITLFLISSGELNKLRIIQVIASGLLMMLFRANGSIALILSVPFILVFIKTYRKKMIYCLAIIVISYIYISGPMYTYIGIEDIEDISESVSIPMQHIARVVVDRSEELSVEERKLIEKVAPLDEIKQTYNCRFSDPMKMLVRSYNGGEVIEKNKGEYAKLWLSLGLKFPEEYVRAQIDATAGYWYPDSQYKVIEVGVYPNEYDIKTVVDPSSDVYLGMYKWCELYRKIPLLGNVYSIGTMFILMLMSIYLAWIEKKAGALLMACPSFMVWLTVMVATPLHSEMRYVYSMILTVPVLIGTVFYPIEK